METHNIADSPQFMPPFPSPQQDSVSAAAARGLGWSEPPFEGIDRRVVRRFLDFHNADPGIYEKFKQYAEVMRQTGKRGYGARSIIERIRWDYDIASTTDAFKINNECPPLFARMLMHENPSFREFFSTRHMKSVRKLSSEDIERGGSLAEYEEH